MRHFILIPLTLALAGALFAADDPKLPPKLDTAYRTYLANLAKAYQAETAKLEAQLKKEAAAAKRDPELAKAVEALQAKLAAHGNLDDLADLVKGDMLDAGRILGGADQLIGTWSQARAPGTSMDGTEEVVIKPKGAAVFTSVWNTNHNTTQVECAWEIATRDGVQVFILYHNPRVRDEKNLNQGAFATSVVQLPLPAAEHIPVTFTCVAMSAGGGTVRSSEQRFWTKSAVKGK